jgi:NAD(P)-dependent dehydrogenase (short-subunit alcohol dehydrogenase family)
VSRIALVTGGAQGIGGASAERFLKDGFRGVVLVDRNAEMLAVKSRELSRFGLVETLVADLMDDATPERVVAAALKAFSTIDVLVNAAGNTERCGIDDTTSASFERLFGVNVKAPLFLMQQAVKPMLKQKSGVIINISSMLAHGGPPNLATYSASKAALNTLTKSAANTYKRDGIRIFAINLGWILTEGEHKTQTEFHKLPENWHEDIGNRMPAGRMITSEDVAGVCAFLVSPSAQMMTGAIIDYEQMPVGVFDDHPALVRE